MTKADEEELAERNAREKKEARKKKNQDLKYDPYAYHSLFSSLYASRSLFFSLFTCCFAASHFYDLCCVVCCVYALESV